MKLKILPTALLLAASSALAQTNGGTGKGLDQLDEQQVMANLANSNLTTLLNRDFDTFKISPSEQAQVMTLIELKELANPVGLNVAGRRALAARVAKGLDGLIPKATDPAVLMEQANQLFAAGIIPDVTELEYFGENPAAQAMLKPVAETAKKMYTRVAELAEASANKMGNGINNANMNAMLPKLAKIRETKMFGIYSDNMATYALCIALPKSDPQRKKLADATIEYLKQFDTPETGVQATMRLQIGKLQLASGDYAAAKATFDTISNLKGITPPPEIAQQNDARYFAIVAEMSARKLKDAAADIPQLETWVIQNYMPRLASPGDQASVKAALSMLKFRLYTAQSDLTNDVNEKKTTNDQAIDVLAKLINDQPSLKDLVYDQLLGRIPADADLTTLNPLILQALEQQGIDEVVKKPDEPTDSKKLTRAIAAAKELFGRKGQSGVDDAAALRASYFVGYGYERLKQQKEAAAAFMDFAEKFPEDKSKSLDAMDHATSLIGELRKKDREASTPDPDNAKLYDRFLPMAINAPYNRKQFAFQYAALLQAEHKYKEAVAYFKLVPESEKKYPEAQYLQMLAMTQQLSDTALPAEDRKQIVSQIIEMTKVVQGLLTNAKTEEDKKKYVEWVVNSEEIAADLTRSELKDPAKSLAILDGFESRIAGSKDAEMAHIQALQLRISAYMDMGKTNEATKQLVQLMTANQDQGQKLMFSVLKTVDNDMDEARAKGNQEDLKQLAQNRAELSGFVVSWASKSKDPKEQAQLPNYQLYDADSKREAAELMEPGEARKARLTEAVAEYQQLVNKNPDNLAAKLGLGLGAYSLGQYQKAVDFLAPLMDNAKVLRPTEEVVKNGTTTIVESTQYWEANYKRLKSLVELYKANPKDAVQIKNLTDANSYLGSLYIINGKKTGGKAYREQFDKLKTEIAGLVKK